MVSYQPQLLPPSSENLIKRIVMDIASGVFYWLPVTTLVARVKTLVLSSTARMEDQPLNHLQTKYTNIVKLSQTMLLLKNKWVLILQRSTHTLLDLLQDSTIRQWCMSLIRLRPICSWWNHCLTSMLLKHLSQEKTLTYYSTACMGLLDPMRNESLETSLE